MPFQLSTKGRYGIRAVSRLALDYEKGPMSIRYIADEEEIPLRYLEQIMNQLRKNGIVDSTRGRSGGYVLSGPPKSMTVARVIEGLEGRIRVVHCIDPEKEECKRADKCLSRELWDHLNLTILDYLKSVTLQDLINGSSGIDKRIHAA